ncbi:MAG: flagellar biosynthesis protein FlhB [Firmicutes bacterium]|nr:flagellar biosynthesis protein FlhB [Bacillota bacterium]
MAHDPSRTEKATPKRREKAREEGSVLRVADLDSTIILWGNLFLFMAAWSAAFLLMGQQTAFFLKRAAEPGVVTLDHLHRLILDVVSIVARILAPFLLTNLLLALGNQFLQHGFKPNPKALQLRFNKLNPASGFKRLLSARSMVEVLKSLMKFLILIWMAYLVIGPRIAALPSLLKMSLGQSLGFMQETLFLLYRNVMIAMLVMALADFLYQRHAFEKSIMMTRQEVKDEAKESEGNPEIKGKQKQIMMASVMRRIQTEVPKAAVVITNPTHFAVALRYDEKTAAPICVAKGADHMALKIRERAKVSGVPLVENPPLARTLFRSVDLDRPIPPELYQAVAQVLAVVFRMKGAA